MDREIKPIPPDASLLNGGESVDTAILDNETANALQNDSTRESTGRMVAKATMGIGVLHVLRLVVGFITQPIIANRMGLLASADVYTISTDIVTSIWRFFEKVVNPTFLPCFIGALKEDGESRAWRFASTTLWLTILALFPTMIIAWLLMPQIVDLYSQKASADQVALTVEISRLLLAGLFFLGISSLTYVILNGYKRFMAAALGDTLWKVGILAGAGAAMTLHMEPVQSLRVISWGFLLGSLCKLLPHVIALKSKWHMIKTAIDWRDPLVKKMLLLSIPLLIGIVVSEGRDVYIKWLADAPNIDVQGSRTALKFSRTIGDSLIQIFPYALSIGIFPYLADLAHEKNKQKLTDTLIGALRVCIWTFGPITAILIAVRFPLLRAVWESGQFSNADTVVISRPFIFYALGMVGFSCEMMLNQTFYAMTNVWVPTAIGILTTGLNMLVAGIGVKSAYGLAAIAGAESLSKTVKCFILWILLRRHLGDVHAGKNLLFFGKVVAGALLASFCSWFISSHIAPTGDVLSRGDKIKLLGSVAVSGFAGMGVFLLWSKLTGIEEVQAMGGLIHKLRKRLSRG